MHTRHWFVVVAVSMFSIGFLLSSGTPVPAQPAEAARPVARFRTEMYNNQVILIDTSNGQCWTRSVLGGGGWADLGSPLMRGK